MRKKLSVIIPVYNEEKYIGVCLSSICKQSLLPDEVIVVDDGSTDRTVKILSEFETPKFRFQVFQQTHQGSAVARNLGARRSFGDILIFVDGDMRFDKHYLKKLVAPIIKRKAKATFTREEYVADSANVWSRCWSVNSYLPQDLHIDPNMPDETTNFRAITRDVFFETQGYLDTGYGGDVTVLEQLPDIRAKAAEGAVCYHYNPSSLWEVFISSRWMGRGEVISARWRSFLIYSLPNSLRRGVWEAFRRRLPWFIPFKIVVDFGVWIGLVEQRLGRAHYK